MSQVNSGQFLSGVNYDWPASVKVHETANLAGDIEVGEHSRIDAFVTITGRVRIGRYVHIGTGVCILGGAGVEIGDYSTLSPGVALFTATDDLESGKLANPTLPDRVSTSQEVKIGIRCVIGSGSVILPGARVGDDIQVGALSLVKGELGSGRIFAGVPAKFIRSRPPLKEIVTEWENMSNTGA